jgi:non-ribosomal peptide synthetase component F
VSNTPLFQVLFVLQNTPVQSLELPGLTFRPIKAEGGKAKFDLAVFVSETGDQLFMEWVYDTDLYSASQIDEMTQHYESLLGYVVAEPNVRLKKIAFQTHYNQGSDPMDKQVRRESKIAKLRRARQLHTEA